MKISAGRIHEPFWTALRTKNFLAKFLTKFLAYAGVFGLFAFIYISISRIYPFNWSGVLRYKILYINGVLTTFKLSVVSIVFSFFLGLVFAIMKVSSIEFFKDIATIYVWLFRNTPLLVVILLTYYGVGSILNINRFWAAVTALSLFEGAYMTEILRSGIEAVNDGEIEAAHSLGLSDFQVFFSIIFPQTLRLSLPPLIGQTISLVKDSSLASVIALGELTMMGRQVGTSSFSTFESYIIVAFIYISLTSLLSLLGRLLERRWSLS